MKREITVTETSYLNRPGVLERKLEEYYSAMDKFCTAFYPCKLCTKWKIIINKDTGLMKLCSHDSECLREFIKSRDEYSESLRAALGLNLKEGEKG
jgi:hypothetical protein